MKPRVGARRPPLDGTAPTRSDDVWSKPVPDLLSQHLYSSPRVYIRELLQNAVDATTARRLVEPGAPSAIRVSIDGDRLSVTDSGIGLPACFTVEALDVARLDGLADLALAQRS